MQWIITNALVDQNKATGWRVKYISGKKICGTSDRHCWSWSIPFQPKDFQSYITIEQAHPYLIFNNSYGF